VFVCVRWGSAVFAYFRLTCGVRQLGELSPVLSRTYIDSIIQRLRMSGYGCVIVGDFFGFIMYADYLVSRSVCELLKMIYICVDELNCIGLSFNVKKGCLLRFGPRYMRVCEPIILYNNKLTYTHKARYLGDILCSGKCFDVDLRLAKSNFYYSFNSIFYSSASY